MKASVALEIQIYPGMYIAMFCGGGVYEEIDHFFPFGFWVGFIN